MSSAIHIQHLRHCTHLRGGDTLAARQRIDHALAEMLDEGLEAALLHAGVDSDEEICIRRLHTLTQLDLSRSDLQLTADWSIAWINDLRGALLSGGDNVVRYRSQLHLLMDMATRVLRGDESRAWAWRQLGFWSGIAPTAPQAQIELVCVLVRHPTAVMPVCTVLAQQSALGGWMATLPHTELRRLVTAALQAANTNPTVLSQHEDEAFSMSVVNDEWMARASQLIATSPLHRELAPIVTAANAVDIAALVVLAAEPTAIRGFDDTRRLLDVSKVLLYVSKHKSDSFSPRIGEQDGGDGNFVSRPATTQSQELLPPRSSHVPITSATYSSVTINELGTTPNTSTLALPRDAGEGMSSQPEASTASAGQHAHTEFGGLMYLLWLIEPSGVLDAVTSESPFALRGLRCALRQMARQLLPLEEDDPILNVFAGLPPLQSPQQALIDAPITPAEAADITVLTNRLVALLRERLREPTIVRERVLDVVCRRSADIHFDPGWIELHFKLDAASIAIRRSGLDRDPGWLSWLGAVVRFAYV